MNLKGSDLMKTAPQAVAAAKSVIGCPYWYACSGQPGTADLLARKIEQYPGKWTTARIAKAKRKIGKSAHVFDCIGLVRWCAGMDKNAAALNVNADRLRQLSQAKPISTLPELPGALVFCPGHVGVYVGKGRVIECWGFVRVDDHPLGFQKWTHWGYCPWIEYNGQLKDDAKAPAKPMPPATGGAFAIGGSVKFKPGTTRYYPSGAPVPDWVLRTTHTVGQVTYDNKTVVKGGKRCVLLKEINSWAAVENLEKV
jgi:hypothetical protein